MRYQQNYRVAVWNTETHSKSNTIILIMGMAVTSGKRSEQDTELACFVICILLNDLNVAMCTVLHIVPENPKEKACAWGF
jgi:hypothetical protein